MIKIQARYNINKEILKETPKVKEAIISNLISLFAKEMYKEKVIEIVETGSKDNTVCRNLDEVEYTAIGYVMQKNEFIELQRLLFELRSYVPQNVKWRFDMLKTLIMGRC